MVEYTVESVVVLTRLLGQPVKDTTARVSRWLPQWGLQWRCVLSRSRPAGLVRATSWV